MKIKNSFRLLFVFLCYSTLLLSQPAHLKYYDMIPMKVQLWGSQFLYDSSIVIRPFLYNKIRNMGADIVVCENVLDAGTDSDYDSVYYAGLKLMPYNKNPSHIDHYIAKYSESSYTIWEAEGTPEEDGDATLARDKVNTGVTTSGTRTCIVTEPECPSGLILSGPGYMQRIRYHLSSDTINYTAQFQMKLDYNPYYEDAYPQLQNNQTVVCTIQVTASEFQRLGNEWEIIDIHVVEDSILKAADFVNYGNWKNFELNYDLSSLSAPGVFADLSTSLLKESTQDEPNVIRYIEYRVVWNQIYFAQLYVDKVILSDDDGADLFTDQFLQTNIMQISNNYLLNWSPAFDNTVVAWYLKDEANFIDNQEPVRLINQLIKNAGGSTGSAPSEEIEVVLTGLGEMPRR